jgi:hypothetical protein
MSMNGNSRRFELDYVAHVGALAPEDRLRFYEALAHNLTVSVRAAWCDETLSDSQKIERIKWLNEISHQVTLKTAYLRLNRNERTEADTWNMIQHYVSLCPELAAEITFATTNSYRAVRGE